MPFPLKNIFYTPQRLKVEQHVKRGFGMHSSLVKEVMYDEDKDDKTPCLLIVFWSSRALSLFGELEQTKHNIEKDFWGGLDHFRIDIVAHINMDSRTCLVRRSSKYRKPHQKP
ncbi:hypothetical protein F5Y00DRAFT_256677 [Daldinia vernicosa]|uniref:uncharacterized protein n=1 Tax=Daldinia vernicosa TaxID=114800 RepID=UPI00200813A2|nr:uncharacterized protein F5Y00DRAFT_256677 [Daldinia vernicosa]KAI0854179.1 hypothetical protein F5Y00DRAFT_256677 [Daldinia vernicosa]